MLFCIFFKIVLGRPGEESLVQSIKFRKNGIDIKDPIYPPFASWDSKYTGLFDISYSDTLEIKATSIYPNPQLYISVNNGQWIGLGNATYTTVLLKKQENMVNVLSTYYNKYHDYVNYTYEFTLFINSFSINASFQSAGFNFSGSNRDNICNQTLNSSEEWLNLKINTEPQGFISIRRLSYVSSDDFSAVGQGSLFTYSKFFINLLENILEVTVSNSSAKQIFIFRFYKTAGMYDIYYNGAIFSEPVDYFGWDLMPRFHPEVYNYTLVRKLPTTAFGRLRIDIRTNYVSVCFLSLSPLSPWPKYTWVTEYPSLPLKVYIKEDNFNIYCASPGLEVYTKNYTIAHYRKSSNTNLLPIKAFVNPLIEVNGSHKSNSSDLPDGFNYKYDLSKLNTWNELNKFEAKNEKWLTYKNFKSFLILDPIEYPKTPAGISLIMIPADPDGYFTYNLYGSLKNSDYFYSSKSIYPINPGYNPVIVNFTAEDRTCSMDYIFFIPVLSPDTTFEYLYLNEYIDGIKYLESYKSEINVFVLYEQLTLKIEAKLNNSNALYEIIYNNQTIYSGSYTFSHILNLEKENEVSEYFIRVIAESQNWVQDYKIKVINVDTCGDGRRWDNFEECDDGNSLEFDGCFKCSIEVNWTCSGGSFKSSDNCTKIDFNTTDPPLTNNTDQPLNNTDNPKNETDQPKNDTDQHLNNTDKPINDTDEFSDDSSGSNESDNGSEEGDSYESSIPNDSDNPESSSNENENESSQDDSSSNNDESSEINHYNISDKSSNFVSKANISPFDQNVPYFYIVLCITGIITVAHFCSKLVNKSIVQKLSVGGVNMAFIPMIWTFQLFYMVGCLNRTPHLLFFSTFEWFLLSKIPKKFEEYCLVFYLIIALSIILLLLMIYFSVKLAKSYNGHKNIPKIVNFSTFIHFYKLFSPIILFSSLQYLLNNPKPSKNPIQLLLSITFILIITISLLYFSWLCITKKNKLSDKKTVKKYEAFLQGLSIIHKVLPLDSRKDFTKLDLGIIGDTKNLTKNLKKRNSFEAKVEEEKPKFYSCPWKQAKSNEDSIEIPEFDLCDPLDEIIPDKSSLCTEVKVPLYYVYSCGFYFVQVICLALSKEIEYFMYILVIVKVFETLYGIWKNPFASALYNRFYAVTNFSLGVMLLFICIINSYPLCFSIIILIIGISLVLSYWWLNFYELIFILKNSKHLLNRPKKTTTLSINHHFEPNESSKIVGKPQNEIFYTEPIQTMREHPVRNCFSFIQPDIQEI